jgi:formyl-CoA transferase
MFLNTGKRSVRLNYEMPDGRAILDELLERADVMVLGLAPARCDILSLEPALLRKRFPRLVVAGVSMFGQQGPYRNFAGTDLIVSALNGSQYESGEPDREPLKYYGYQPSNLAGVHAAIAVLAGIIQRSVTGQGSILDISIMRSGMIVSEGRITERALTGTNVGRAGLSVQVFPPPLYRCSDGFVAMLATDDQWPRLCAMADMPELGSDPRFASAPGRSQHFEELDLYFQPWFLGLTKSELFELGRKFRMPIAPVNSPEEILEDQHFKERAVLETVDGGNGTSYQTFGLFFQAGQEGVTQPLRPAPLLGENTEDVLQSELDYGSAQISSLRASGAI